MQTASSVVAAPASVCCSTWSSSTLAAGSSPLRPAKSGWPGGMWKAISVRQSSLSSPAVSSAWNSIMMSSFICCAWDTSRSGISNATLPSTVNIRLPPLMATPPQLRPVVAMGCSWISHPNCLTDRSRRASRSFSRKPKKFVVGPSLVWTPSWQPREFLVQMRPVRSSFLISSVLPPFIRFHMKPALLIFSTPWFTPPLEPM
mmetsp:Transcript_4974/g.10723  ORF Transcript_4974/g.10723 Transcript_4974/m.10723 type:complete len:202 (+) Transcript_4974:2078-2683(+)